MEFLFVRERWTPTSLCLPTFSVLLSHALNFRCVQGTLFMCSYLLRLTLESVPQSVRGITQRHLALLLLKIMNGAATKKLSEDLSARWWQGNW